MQVQFEKIPPFLKSYAQFCNWKYEQRDGNQTKVPYIPGTTRRASVSDPATFAAFDAAASATDYDGIGIRVSGRIVGIDLDHCVEDGNLLPWAQPIVDRFKDTYIEISPSGTGLRIFCLLPDDFSYDTQTYYIKHGDIEIYIPSHTNRFLTVTGNALTEADVVETAEALVWLLDTYMRRPTPPTPSVAVPGTSYLSDDSVITKASEAKNGEKFRRLWSGDITGYPSHSEADAALASMLAFWCGGDAGQIDRLFRQSGLMREKWDELRGADTYGNLTIAKALSGMTDSYNSGNDTILGKPVRVCEFMPDAASGNKPIAFGDFSYYWVVLRAPFSLRTLTEEFALHDQIGYLALEYLDGKLVRRDAVKVLQMK